MSEAKEETRLGDMSAEEFRRYGHRLVDWIADYLSNAERYPVLSRIAPGQIKSALPPEAPARGESMDDILEDFERLILPGITHWNHPAFFAYFAITGSAPGILAEMIAAALNVNAMLWRTSPAATELEEVTADWLRRLLGLPEEFGAVIYDTASISSLCALAAAREVVPSLSARERGLAASPIKLRLYASEHAHSSIEKAAITLGLGQASLRKIPVDDQYRMDVRALERAIQEDRSSGWKPFCVVATVGTTSTTSIDPVPRIADICEREQLWLHVDAAYGGSAAILPEMRWVLDGCQRADSIVVNPHKWLFVQIDLSVLFCRRMDALRRAFSLVPEYLRSPEGEVKNFMDYGPQLGRRFRALKLWFVMRYFGAEGLADRIRHHIALARQFASWVEGSSDFELLAPVHFSTVCFRARPRDLKRSESQLNSLNRRLLEEVNAEGRVFLSHTELGGRFALRLAVGNIRTTGEHVRLAQERLAAALERLRGEV